MGKDNITFHTVLWPAILIGAGDLHLPDDIVASEFLHMEGTKLSTSRGNVIYVKDMLDRYDPDALRYYLMIAGPENQDTDFTWSEFVRRNNDELVATWGNLVHRTLVNAHRNFGAVPEPGPLSAADETLIGEVEEALDYVGQQLGEAPARHAGLRRRHRAAARDPPVRRGRQLAHRDHRRVRGGRPLAAFAARSRAQAARTRGALQAPRRRRGGVATSSSTLTCTSRSWVTPPRWWSRLSRRV